MEEKKRVPCHIAKNIRQSIPGRWATDYIIRYGEKRGARGEREIGGWDGRLVIAEGMYE